MLEFSLEFSRKGKGSRNKLEKEKRKSFDFIIVIDRIMSRLIDTFRDADIYEADALLFKSPNWLNGSCINYISNILGTLKVYLYRIYNY